MTKCPKCSGKIYIVKSRDGENNLIESYNCSKCLSSWPKESMADTKEINVHKSKDIFERVDKIIEQYSKPKSIKVFRIRPDAKIPRREHSTDAGADLFYCPDPAKRDDWILPVSDSGDMVIYPGRGAVIPTGIKVEIPYGYMLEIKNKSGIAAKRGLITGACVVDHLFGGEIFVNLWNVGSESQVLTSGTKLAQVVLIPVEYASVIEVLDEKELNKETERGDGCLGSTGDK